MIVSVSIEEDGAIHVHLDSDGDQGDAYAPEVLDDMLSRASRTAVDTWAKTHAKPATKAARRTTKKNIVTDE